ncbi:MAG: nucleotidyl transferase AbiEii/AbiGii toxin family protein [Deltaproteobacteria bacterium]|nr:nucleotidyl transferase AbiEii/AbiGii toxin family protein [Deltaproteobacteria bacterium]
MNTPLLFTSDMSNTDREYIFRQASIRTGLPAYIIEKDYMVCLVLSAIFEDLKPQYTYKTATPFLFKGGTTLSKVYNVINRMSEDIDLSISMKFLGDPEPEIESRSAREKRIKRLSDSNRRFVSSIFKSFLVIELEKIHEDFMIHIDSDETQNLIINYPRSLSASDYLDNYVKPQILIETGGKAGFDPHISYKIEPYALDEIRELLKVEEDCCATVDVLDIERTFFEKLTLLHELNHRGVLKGVQSVKNRQARHIYDLVQIYKSDPTVVRNFPLLEEVRSHKEKYFRSGPAKWDEAKPGTLFIISIKDIEDALRNDWRKMTDMFPGGQLPYTFDEMMLVLEEIDRKIN